MLRIDFYESGIGETIIITFPSGGIGVVDAHPSPTNSRLAILELVNGREVHFVCLTHPHADHGVDLVPILKNGPTPKVLWHTIPNFKEFIYYTTDLSTFTSPIREFVEKYNSEWANCFLDIFGTAKEKGVPRRQLRSDLQHEEIDGVRIHFLSPEENIATEFTERYAKEIKSAEPEGGDPNVLSAILALEYGKSVVLLGGDALKKNWYTAVPRFRKAGLPKAVLLKVPHHGAKNAFSPGSRSKWPGYLDLCATQPQVTAVIFAGDVDHPHPAVYEQLKAKTAVTCLVNGLKSKTPKAVGGISLPRKSEPAKVCQPQLGFSLDQDGAVTQLVGGLCKTCPLGEKVAVPVVP
jgi:beta-lactamase superfamily II metal-dependent hydrolase